MNFRFARTVLPMGRMLLTSCVLVGAVEMAWSIGAHADARAVLSEIKDGKRIPAHKWMARHQWKWTLTEGDVSVLKSIVTIVVPDGVSIAKLKTHSSKWLKDQNFADNEAQVLMATMDEELTVVADDGTRTTLNISLQVGQNEVVSNGCESYTLDLARTEPQSDSKRPFYLGMACRASKQGTVVTVSIPKDVAWGSTTIFETSGKGEAWHQYLITKLGTGDKGEVGKLSFAFGGEVSQYSIINKKTVGIVQVIEGAENEERWVRFRVGGGPGLLAVSTPTLNGSLFHLGLSLDAETKKFFRVMRAQVGLDLALPVQSGSQGADFFDIYVALKPVLQAGAFTFGPGVYFISMLGHFNSGSIAYEFNEPGLGLEIRWLRPRGSNANLTVFGSGVVPSSKDTFLGVTAGYRFSQGPLGRFGIDLQYRKVQLLDTNGGLPTMSDTLLNFVWAI